jgi:hypothetical protein
VALAIFPFILVVVLILVIEKFEDEDEYENEGDFNCSKAISRYNAFRLWRKTSRQPKTA